MRAAHDLKSEAGTLGMLQLQEAATDLELACVAGATEIVIEGGLREVSKWLAAVSSELDPLCDGDPS
jgi:HPt (histidine-containing phosphotransfer) domain-containing protein